MDPRHTLGMTIMALTSSVGTGASIPVSPVVTTTYYVTADLNGCVSTVPASTIVTVTEPLAPTVTGATVCEADPTDANYELSAACIAGETVNWYDSASGGTLLSANSTTIFQQVRRPYQKEPILTLRNVLMRTVV